MRIYIYVCNLCTHVKVCLKYVLNSDKNKPPTTAKDYKRVGGTVRVS